MNEKLKKNLYYLSFIVLAILTIFLVRLLKIYDICCTILEITSPILFGFIFAWILEPIFKKLANRFNKFWASGILIIAFLAFYTFLIWKILPIVINNLGSFGIVVENYLNKLEEYPFFEGLDDIKIVDMNILLESCGSIVSVIVTVVLVHIFGFYILYNYDMVVKFLKSLVPLKYKKIFLEYTRKLSLNMRLYIKGTLLDTLILFIASSIFYLIIGLPYPVMLAGFSAITNIIPFVGPYIGGVPAVLVALGSSVNLALVTVLVIVFLQTVESNIINPMIMSKCIKINPLLIIIALTVVGKFLGLFGMILAVPLLIVLKLTYEFLKKYEKIKVK